MRIRIATGFWYILSFVLATAVSAGLLGADRLLYGDQVPAYMLWNLFLAWVPLGLVLWLLHIIRRKSWSSWEGLLVTAAWLVFLPNSFYMISDFIHLGEISGPNQLLFSAVMFTSFIYTGVLLGLSSLYMVHIALRKRLGPSLAAGAVGMVLAMCSLAIYVGRDLRWNSWDILTDPAGLLFDVSSRLLHPSQYGSILLVVVPFFVLLASVYVVLWQGSRLFRIRHDFL